MPPLGSPLSQLDPLDALVDNLVSGLNPIRPRAAYPPLPEEEHKSLVRELLGQTMGGLQWVGESLDKTLGGRTVRGLLGGQGLGSLAHLIPFSDTLGLTDAGGVLGSNLLASKEATPGGRDLLEQAGMLDANTPGLDWGDVAGLGAEIALDPSTYFTFGGAALTKAGKAAKAAKRLPKGRMARITGSLGDALAGASPEALEAASKAAERMGTTVDDLTGPLGGLAKFWPTGTAIGTGPLGQSIAGGLDVAGEAIKYNPLSRGVRGLFDYTTQGMFGKPEQQLAEGMSDLLPEYARKGEMAGQEHARAAQQLYDDFRQAFQEDVYKGLVQNAPESADFDVLLKQSAEKTDELFQRFYRANAEMNDPIKAFQSVFPESGIPGTTLEDLAKFDFPVEPKLPKKPVAPAAGDNFDLITAMRKLASGADRGELVGIRELRREAEKYGVPKEAFDAYVLGEMKAGKVSLRRHDYVGSLTPEEVNNLIYDPKGHYEGGAGSYPKGTYYLGASIRHGANVPPPAAAKASAPVAKAVAPLVKFARHPYAGTTESMVALSTSDLDQLWQQSAKQNYIPPGGESQAGKRAAAEQFVGSGKPVEAPRVVFDNAGNLDFRDGQHRFAVLRDQGVENVKVMVEHEDLPKLKQLLGGSDIPSLPPILERFGPLANDAKQHMSEVANQFKAMGGNLSLLQQDLQFAYFPRKVAKKFKEQEAKHPTRVAPTSFGHAKPREEALRYLDTETVERLRNDPGLKDEFYSPLEEIDYIRKHYSNEVTQATALENKAAQEIADAKAAKIGKPVDPAFVSEEEVAQRMAEWGRDARGGGRMYNLNSLEDLSGWFRGIHRAMAGTEAIHETLFRNATEGGGVALKDVFKRAGMDAEAGAKHFAQKFGKDPAKLRVPEDVSNAVVKLIERGRSPEWTNKTVEAIDKVNSFIKQNLNLPFPGSRLRDLVGGQWMNMAAGPLELKDVPEYMRNVAHARDIMRNPDKFADLIDEMKSAGVISPKLGVRDIDVLHGFQLGDVPKPALSKEGVLGAFSEAKTAVAENPPLLDELTGMNIVGRIPGAKAVRTGYQTVMNMGANVAHQTSWYNNVPMYLTLREKGWTPVAAGQEVLKLQVDYHSLAPFEKQVMRRLVPFYTFSRKTLPVLLENMLQKPGGIAGRTVTTGALNRTDDEFVPPYVGEGLAFKLGEGRYLSGTGLPVDLLSDYFATGPTALSTAKRMGQKALSSLNPLIKGPLETITGQSMYTGRPVEELYQYPSGDILTNQLAYSSPFSRYLNIARTLQDPRKGPIAKGVNLLTGARVTDVSGGPERQAELAARKINEEVLRQRPNEVATFTDFYARKGIKPSAETEKLLRLVAGFEKHAKAEKKKKKPQPANAPPPS